DRHGLLIIDLRTIFKLYFASPLSSEAFNNDTSSAIINGLAAVVYFCGGDNHFASPRGIVVDDTSSELYVSDQMNHRVQVYTFSPVALAELKIQHWSTSTAKLPLPNKRGGNAPVVLTRSFGVKGHGEGQLQRPGGVDVSHYHVVVCDVGNNRLAVFTKRGAFVTNYGSKGTGEAQFHDIRDVKLLNVKKRAIVRGFVDESTTIGNEQFDVIVADLGNFRIHVLNEKGEFVRQLSLLANNEQIAFQRDRLSELHASLLREYTSLNVKNSLPPGLTQMDHLYALAKVLHPSSPAYARITATQSAWHETHARFHHPLAIAYAPVERELLFADHENAKVFIYNAYGSRSTWLNLSQDALRGVSSVHSVLQLCASHHAQSKDESDSRACSDRLVVSDPQSHRIAVFDATSLNLLFYIGTTTYGNQTLCANGFLSGELNHPSFLAFFAKSKGEGQEEQEIVAVSDTGNHRISLFDAGSGAFCCYIGAGFGHLEGYLDSPQGVAVYEKHQWLFVCDQHNHRVQVFDLVRDRFVRAFGRNGSKPGEFHFPTGIAVCAALPQPDPKCKLGSHRDAKILVADTGNNRLQVFALPARNEEQEFPVLMVLDVHSTPFAYPLAPMGVHIEQRSGYLLVCDAANQCVLVFRNDGTFVTSFGSTVEPENRFVRPMALYLSSAKTSGEALDHQQHQQQNVLIADAGRCDVCIFSSRAHGG
uniref:Uncharacterized protein n=1 Tax=Globisporangium ultimum (strain ATCC 200006 / CBS 805.95 / DAOM BR144) TaxID=431595 RepID=K3WQD8_GLOUD